MDLSRLSEEDLLAIEAGEMHRVSDEGLRVLAGESGPRFRFGALDSALQGASFGFSDEVGAAKDALQGRGSYSENLRDRRLAQQLFERENPGLSLTAELGGALLPSLVGGGAVYAALRGPQIAARVGPTAARYGGAAAGGATTGALTGAGTAEEGQRVEGAVRGGVTGAVLGPALAGGVQLVTKGAQVARDATVGIPLVQQVVGAGAGVLGATTDFNRRAQEKLLQALRRDRLTPEEIMLARNVMGDKPETLIERAGANTLGLADVATKYPGEAKRLATDLAVERMGGQAERVVGDLTRAFRVQGDPVLVAEALARQRAAAAQPLYAQAYSEAGVIADPRINAFMQLPAFQRAYGVARRLAKYDGVDLPKDPRNVSQFDLRTLDYVKRGLDDVLYQSRMPGPGGTGLTERRKISEARDAFVATLDELSPTYARARAAWAGPTALREALEKGQDIHRLRLPELQETLSRMSAAEVEQFKLGALSAIRQRINEVSDGRDLVRVVYGSPEKRAILARLVGDEFPELERNFLRERAIRRTDDTIRGNSRTAERQAGMEDLAGDTTVTRSIMNQGPVRGLTDYLLRSGTGVAQPTADRLGPMLFSTDPRAQQKVLEELMMLDRIYRQRAGGVGVGVGTGAGTAGGLLSD